MLRSVRLVSPRILWPLRELQMSKHKRVVFVYVGLVMPLTLFEIWHILAVLWPIPPGTVIMPLGLLRNLMLCSGITVMVSIVCAVPSVRQASTTLSNVLTAVLLLALGVGSCFLVSFVLGETIAMRELRWAE